MKQLDISEQNEILRVIDYLVETQNTGTTVQQVMDRFGLTVDEYRMCSNLAMPALKQGNLEGRLNAVRKIYKTMRRDIKDAYGKLDEKDDGGAARVVRRMYRAYCDRSQAVVYAEDEGEE